MLVERHEQILALWLQRDFSLQSIGMKDHHILEEIERLRKCETFDDYKRVKRIGSTLPLSRKGRFSIWSLLENAKKHARIEKEMKKSVDN
jgi:hypothetical protein